MPFKHAKSKRDLSVIKFGPAIRRDTGVQYAIIHLVGFTDPNAKPEDRRPVSVKNGTITKKTKGVRIELPIGEPYMVFLSPGKITAGESTRGEVIRAPFYLTIDSRPKPAASKMPRRKPATPTELLGMEVKRLINK